ncbi:RNA methyltransferase [Oceanidesulfovibrio indonesiensis]|uniref:tRNA (cytidine/uridine-2'-O-)-methyltransferase TrmJ n=1 Tax=Oceanidesulfovibrio indonesiensis TaxID=54767 RepID=A0A7M3MI63_9BACT|nr:RNA methyltransferase [Oceanidesulfovibrio indonesiensis]TVM18883.1 RNA methyltransferase [Oceanidesulfovibrio indonesiensis]
MLSNLAIVLVKTKFPENVGSTARAMANMGASELVLVSPQSWDEDRALALATPKGAPIIRSIRVEDDLGKALAPYVKVYATTARTGGWRKGILTPAQAATEAHEFMAEGKIAVLFGPEDRGLTNEEVEIGGRLLTIPTVDDASSLNLAQAVLVILYEWFTAAPGTAFRPAGPPTSRLATHAEQEALFSTLQDTLLAIDFLKDDNPSYWMLPVRRFLARIKLRKSEFNLLMGICRQVRWMCSQRCLGPRNKDAEQAPVTQTEETQER